MKILQVVDDFPPSVAGDGIHVYQISKELVRRDHQVTVFTTDHGVISNSNVDAEGHEMIDGIKVRRYHPFIQFSYFSFSPKLFMSMLREDFDVVHIHRYFSLLSYPAMLMSKLRGRPLVFTPHSATVREKKNTLMASIKKVFDCTMGRSLIRSPNILIALTQDNVRDYLELGAEPDRIRVIPNGISLEKSKSLPDPSKFREKYGITEDMVLFVGRLVKYKGVQYLLQTAPKVLEEAPKTKFVIVGPDFGYMKELRKLVETLNIQNSVIFAGAVSDYELLEAYSAADVFAFPSIHEGFGMVLLDAMACKKPVVTWKTSAMQYIVTDQTGFLVDPWSLEDFAHAIITLLLNRKLANEMGENGRKIVEEKFEWEIIINALEAVYKELTGE